MTPMTAPEGKRRGKTQTPVEGRTSFAGLGDGRRDLGGDHHRVGDFGAR
jgi:hypothetical protein